MTDQVDLEVGRYALRTFRPVWSWRDVKSRGPMLSSVAIGGLHWGDGTCRAKCIGGSMTTWPVCGDPKCPLCGHLDEYKMRRHDSPYEGCSCGIYGCLSFEHLRRQYPEYACRIVAVIAAEGKTILGDRGLRTEYARVVAYWHYKDFDYYEMCRKQFGDAKHFLDLGQMLIAYGLPKCDSRNAERMKYIRQILARKIIGS